jgi:hypothetical protein
MSLPPWHPEVRVEPSWLEADPVPTYRVICGPHPGVRLLIEDVEADAVRGTPAHIELSLDMIDVSQPREIIALRARRQDMTEVLLLCTTSTGGAGIAATSRERPGAHQGRRSSKNGA